MLAVAAHCWPEFETRAKLLNAMRGHSPDEHRQKMSRRESKHGGRDSAGNGRARQLPDVVFIIVACILCGRGVAICSCRRGRGRGGRGGRPVRCRHGGRGRDRDENGRLASNLHLAGNEP